MAADPERPDAVLVRAGTLGGDRPRRYAEITARYGLRLGGPLYFRDIESPAGTMATPSPDATYLFAAGHPRAGSPRYHWIPVEPGVEFGWLVPDDAPEAVPAELSADVGAIRRKLSEAGLL